MVWDVDQRYVKDNLEFVAKLSGQGWLQSHPVASGSFRVENLHGREHKVKVLAHLMGMRKTENPEPPYAKQNLRVVERLSGQRRTTPETYRCLSRLYDWKAP